MPKRCDELGGGQADEVAALPRRRRGDGRDGGGLRLRRRRRSRRASRAAATRSDAAHGATDAPRGPAAWQACARRRARLGARAFLQHAGDTHDRTAASTCSASATPSSTSSPTPTTPSSTAEGLTKGSMRLIDEAEAERLYGAMGAGARGQRRIGGQHRRGPRRARRSRRLHRPGRATTSSARFYRHDIRSLGVDFDHRRAATSAPTARCLILVTPDAQRTMNTFLGAAQMLDAERARRGAVADAGDPLSRRLSVGPGGAARRDGCGDRRRPRRRPQGRLHLVRQLLHRPPPRRLPAR